MHFTQERKKEEEKTVVKPSSSYSKARNVFNLPHIVDNNVEGQKIFVLEQGSLSVFIIDLE